MMKYYFVIVILILILIGIAIYFTTKNKSQTQNSQVQTTTSKTQTQTQKSETLPVPQKQLVDPIAQFKLRITKKPFGIYIAPKTSPVQPEKFTGYHTGVDVEYTDVTADVPVYAIVDCNIIYSNYVSGYGGVFIIEFKLNGQPRSALYGHIRPSSLPKVGARFNKSDKIAVLGTGYSSETDGERKHLHFAILSNNRIDFKGYVQTKSELPGWINPLDLYP